MEKRIRNASIRKKKKSKGFLRSVSEKILFVTLGNMKAEKTRRMNETFERGE